MWVFIPPYFLFLSFCHWIWLTEQQIVHCALLNLCSGSACSTVNGFCLNEKESMSMIPFWGLYSNNLHMFTRQAVVPIGLVQMIKCNRHLWKWKTNLSAWSVGQILYLIINDFPYESHQDNINKSPLWQDFEVVIAKVLHCKNHTYRKYSSLLRCRRVTII